MIIDTAAETTTHISRLQTAGVSTVIRYLSPIDPRGEKCVKAEEAKALAQAGIKLGLVNEGWGDFAHGGISAGAGERDGEFSFGTAASVGAPDGACIYFAVDTDASCAQIKKLVLPYFESIARSKGNYRTGVYGSGAVCAAVLDAGLADCAWLACSMGWTSSRAFLAGKRWALRQHLPAHIGGIEADPDDGNGDFGDFLAFGTDTAPQNADTAAANADAAPQNADSGEYGIKWVQGTLNTLYGLHLALDGIWGRETREAIKRFQHDKGLAEDGIAGPQTIAALEAALAAIFSARPTA